MQQDIHDANRDAFMNSLLRAVMVAADQRTVERYTTAVDACIDAARESALQAAQEIMSGFATYDDAIFAQVYSAALYAAESRLGTVHWSLNTPVHDRVFNWILNQVSSRYHDYHHDHGHPDHHQAAGSDHQAVRSDH